jgi:hypothetical protein
MGKGSYKLALQHGQQGYYAHVTLQVEKSNNLTSQGWVRFEPSVNQEWQMAAHFGIEYAWEHIRKHFAASESIKVIVQEIHGMEVDTTIMCVAYAAALAVFNACNIEPAQKPILDEGRGIFLFPR